MNNDKDVHGPSYGCINLNSRVIFIHTPMTQANVGVSEQCVIFEPARGVVENNLQEGIKLFFEHYPQLRLYINRADYIEKVKDQYVYHRPSQQLADPTITANGVDDMHSNAVLVENLKACKTNGEMLSLIVNYRYSIRKTITDIIKDNVTKRCFDFVIPLDDYFELSDFCKVE